MAAANDFYFRFAMQLRRPLRNAIFCQIGPAQRNSTSGFRVCLLAAFWWLQGIHVLNFSQISKSVAEL